jgi:nitrogen regulatory protein PII
MKYKTITATIDVQRLEDVERSLHAIGVPGVSVTETKGYGVYKNYFQRDWLVTHARIQLHLTEDKVEEAVEVIMSSAHTGSEDDGLIVISPVDRLYSIRERTEV